MALSRDDLAEILADAVLRICNALRYALSQAGVRADQIQTVFLTGGSTLVPFVEQSISHLFPISRTVKGDMFGSVGLGLTLDARRKFGTR